MLAKIKKTGEILKIAEWAKIQMEACDSYGNPLEFSPEEIELLNEIKENDEKREYGLSVHVATIPCMEEIMAGVNAHYDAYIMKVPSQFIPREVIDVLEGKNNSKSITFIAFFKQ